MTDEQSGRDRYLPIYLNDHLAGSAGGLELARRVLRSNEDDEKLRAPLKEVCEEIEVDRATLKRLMERLGVRRSLAKPAIAWVGERLGRLKLNGQLTGYSPLSRLVELEALCVGIGGKLELWRAMEHTLGREWEGFDFAELSERARRQREKVEALHRGAAAIVFSAKPLTGTD